MKSLLRHVVELASLRLGLSHLPFLLHRLLRRRPILLALAYHRIVDGQQTAGFYTDYDRGMDARVFRVHLDALQRHFRLIGLDEFIAVISGQRPPSGHSVLLTFDDADAGFVEYALPELRRRRLPAVVMAPTDFIGVSEQLWHVRISNIISHATPGHWQAIQERLSEWPEPVASVISRTPDPGPVADRRPLCRALNAALDKVDHGQIDRLVDAWQALVDPSTDLPIYCMTWDNLRELEASGIAVESHTASHRKLTTLSDSDLDSELRQSKAAIEAQLAKRVRSFAYPQGYIDPRVPGAARAAGYEVGFTTVRTPVNYPLDSEALFRIPRLDVHGDTPGQVDVYLARVAIRCLWRTKPW